VDKLCPVTFTTSNLFKNKAREENEVSE